MMKKGIQSNLVNDNNALKELCSLRKFIYHISTFEQKPQGGFYEEIICRMIALENYFCSRLGFNREQITKQAQSYRQDDE